MSILFDNPSSFADEKCVPDLAYMVDKCLEKFVSEERGSIRNVHSVLVHLRDPKKSGKGGHRFTLSIIATDQIGDVHLVRHYGNTEYAFMFKKEHEKGKNAFEYTQDDTFSNVFEAEMALGKKLASARHFAKKKGESDTFFSRILTDSLVNHLAIENRFQTVDDDAPKEPMPFEIPVEEAAPKPTPTTAWAGDW